MLLTFSPGFSIVAITCRRSMAERKERLLFVDDDPELREIVRDQLAEAGYEVDEAEDGDMTAKKLAKKAYDLVLLDINLPGKTGLDILKFIKARSLACRVIMLTGVVGLGTAIESLTMGADDYITKPYTLEHLLSAIRRSLQKKPA
jgi:DNA-binding response OmpR family regulator